MRSWRIAKIEADNQTRTAADIPAGTAAPLVPRTDVGDIAVLQRAPDMQAAGR
jgi:hypothetical protein